MLKACIPVQPQTTIAYAPCSQTTRVIFIAVPPCFRFSGSLLMTAMKERNASRKTHTGPWEQGRNHSKVKLLQIAWQYDPCQVTISQVLKSKMNCWFSWICETEGKVVYLLLFGIWGFDCWVCGGWLRGPELRGLADHRCARPRQAVLTDHLVEMFPLRQKWCHPFRFPSVALSAGLSFSRSL